MIYPGSLQYNNKQTSRVQEESSDRCGVVHMMNRPTTTTTNTTTTPTTTATIVRAEESSPMSSHQQPPQPQEQLSQLKRQSPRLRTLVDTTPTITESSASTSTTFVNNRYQTSNPRNNGNNGNSGSDTATTTTSQQQHRRWQSPRQQQQRHDNMTNSSSSIPYASFPTNAPHLQEEYIINVMICMNDDDDDDDNRGTIVSKSTNTATASASSSGWSSNHHSNYLYNPHYRWSIMEGQTYYPLKMWRTKPFTIQEIEQQEATGSSSSSSTTGLFFSYIPSPVIQTLLTGSNTNSSGGPPTTTSDNNETNNEEEDDDDDDKERDVVPSTKKRKSRSSSNDHSIALPKLPQWNALISQQVTPQDIYQFRSHHFTIPMVSIYCIFPPPITINSSNHHNGTTTNHHHSYYRSICSVAERGLQCMFRTVLPCRLYRIDHSIHHRLSNPAVTDLVSNNNKTNKNDDDVPTVTFTSKNNGNCHNSNNTTKNSNASTTFNLNEMAIQSILHFENSKDNNNESSSNNINNNSNICNDETEQSELSNIGPVTTLRHHFLFINGGGHKTTFTSYCTTKQSIHKKKKDTTTEVVQNEPSHTTTINQVSSSSSLMTAAGVGDDDDNYQPSKCQYMSLMQRFVQLHQDTGALPNISKEEISQHFLHLPSVAKEQRPHTILPLIAQNTNSAMIGTVLRTYLLTLHHTIKSWVYNIWDDIASTTTTSATTNVVTPQVVCCITGIECEMMLQLLQFSPEQLLDQFELVTDPDLTWISPSRKKIDISVDSIGSYFYSTFTLGPPIRFIQVRRLKQSTNTASNSHCYPTTSNDSTPSVVKVAMDNHGGPQQYEYITVGIYKQRHILVYGLQHVLFHYSRERNKALLLNGVCHTDENKALNGECIMDTDDVPLPSISSTESIDYLRLRMHGCRLAKYFGNDIYIGYVTAIDPGGNRDSTTTTTMTNPLLFDLLTIQYDDGDVEDMNIREFYEQLQLYLDVINDYTEKERTTIHSRIVDARYVQSVLKTLLCPQGQGVQDREGSNDAATVSHTHAPSLISNRTTTTTTCVSDNDVDGKNDINSDTSCNEQIIQQIVAEGMDHVEQELRFL